MERVETERLKGEIAWVRVIKQEIEKQRVVRENKNQREKGKGEIKAGDR